MNKPKARFVHLLADDDANYSFIGNEGRLFYFTTNYNAPKEKIIAVHLDKPGKEHWIDIIPEQEDVLTFVKIINEQFVVCYLHNAHYKLAIYDLEGHYKKKCLFLLTFHYWCNR